MPGHDDLAAGSDRERRAVLLTMNPAIQLVRAAGLQAQVSIENFAARGHISEPMRLSLELLASTFLQTADEMEASMRTTTEV
jgi:hypothetical protein